MRSMKTRFIATVFLVTAATLAACSPPHQQDSTAPTTSEVLTTAVTASALGPIIITTDELAEVSEVSISLDRPLSLTGGTDPAAWTIFVSDPSIAEFVPGEIRGSASFNPGVRALTIGETTVTVTGPQGISHDVSVNVVADNSDTGKDR